MNKNKIIFIVGPTGIGKTAIAVNLAKRINGEIISADSMQVYKGTALISQRPAASEMRKVKHHLINFLSPWKEYSAALFAKKAKDIIKDIIKRKKTPIVVGGSGLYVRALIDGIFPSKGRDVKLRRKLEELAAKKGNLILFNKLKKIDPASALTIHPNDLRRIIRTLEIYEVEKKTKTSLKPETKGIKDEYDIYLFGLSMPREKIYERINKRVERMFTEGLVKEVKGLLKKNLSLTVSQAIGIKEIKGFLERRYGLLEAKELVKCNTRRFAKRQFTWFRADKRIEWLDLDKLNEEELLRRLQSGEGEPSLWNAHYL